MIQINFKMFEKYIFFKNKIKSAEAKFFVCAFARNKVAHNRLLSFIYQRYKNPSKSVPWFTTLTRFRIYNYINQKQKKKSQEKISQWENSVFLA